MLWLSCSRVCRRSPAGGVAAPAAPYTVPALAKQRVPRGAPHTPYITTTNNLRVRVHDSMRPLWATHPKDVLPVGTHAWCPCMCPCRCTYTSRECEYCTDVCEHSTTVTSTHHTTNVCALQSILSAVQRVLQEPHNQTDRQLWRMCMRCPACTNALSNSPTIATCTPSTCVCSRVCVRCLLRTRPLSGVSL